MRNLYIALGLATGMLLTGMNLARAQSATMTDQAIGQHVYESCMQDAKLGAPGGELEGNCQCEAQVTLSVLTDAGRTAIATGTPPQGAMFTVDQDGFSQKVIRACPGVRPILEHHFCDADTNSQACLKLKNDLQQTP